MFLHKLHVNDMIHTLNSMSQVLKDTIRQPLNYAKRSYFLESVTKIKSFNETLEEAVNYISRDGKELREIMSVLHKHSSKDEDYIKNVIPKIVQEIMRVEEYTKELENKILNVSNLGFDVVESEEKTKLIDSSVHLIDKILSNLTSIKLISNATAEMLEKKHSEVKKELAYLQKELGLVEKMSHNINSWLLH